MGILKNLLVTGSARFVNIIKGTVQKSQNGAFYGTCTTAAATAEKAVTLTDGTDFELVPGVVIGVKFTNTNTADNAKLNVNGTGAKSIWYNIAVYTGHDAGITGYANRIIYYMYDGTNWVFINQSQNYASNSYNYPSAQCGTAAATAAKVANCTSYTLTTNTYLHFNIQYANTSKTALTMNVNSKGAKPIYINGTASSASNYTLPAGSYIAFYNGTNWYFRTDGKLPAKIDGDAATVGGHGVETTLANDSNLPTGAAVKSYVDSASSYSSVVYRGQFTGDIDSLTIDDGEWLLHDSDSYTHASLDDQGLDAPIWSTFVQYTASINGQWGIVRTQIIYTPSMIYARKYNGQLSSWYDWCKFTSMNATTYSDGLMTSADKIKLNYTNIFYGTCTTAAATAAKVVTLANASNFSLVSGAIIGVRFSNTNTASNVTLNVDDTGAKQIYYDNASYPGSSALICGTQNVINYYMYNGTYWAFISNGKAITNYLPEMNGILGVDHGGTGATSLTAGAALIGNGTNAVTTRTIRNNTTNGSIGWTSGADSISLLTQNDIAYWNGRYNNTASNLAYCNKGAFNNAVTYDVETTLADDAKLPTGSAVKTYVDSKAVITKTVTGTTTSSGALNVDLNDYRVLGAKSTNTTNHFAFCRGDGYLTVFQISNNTMTVLANTSVTFDVYYCAV